jgi:rRNA small subunit pseudouridine methyltransferase Nep1
LLNLVLTESALELVPKEIRGSPPVISDARRRGLDSSEILLDRSFHHPAMGRLKDSVKRGRPDLVHVALLAVTGTPLYLEGKVRVYVHTYPDVVLELEEKTRIPKSYFRFRGLVEKALVEMPEDGLVRAYQANLRDLFRKIVKPDEVVGLSTQGKGTDLEVLAKEVLDRKNPAILVGGFPHGHFSPGTLQLVDRLVRIGSKALEAHVVVSRLVYEVEKALDGTND